MLNVMFDVLADDVFFIFGKDRGHDVQRWLDK